MFGITAALSVARGVAEAELDGFRVGYVGEDGTPHRVPLAGARAVRFEVMTPARRFAAVPDAVGLAAASTAARTRRC